MKHFLGFTLIAAIASWAIAQQVETAKPQDKVDPLTQRIEQLEKRVAELESAKKATPDELGQQTPKAQAQWVEQRVLPPRAGKDSDQNYVPQIKGLAEEDNQLLEDLARKQRDDIPSNWSPRRFNGFTYYIVPLTHGQSSSESNIIADAAIAR